MDNGIGPDLRIYKGLENKEFTVLTLRDIFAAAALGMEGIAVEEAADIAKRAYLIADALITEREK